MIETIGDGILKIVGSNAGPTIVVFGGVHGNELTGIEVVQKMRSIFVGEGRDLPERIEHGTLYLILGNPKAIAQNSRGSYDHADLNRCFTLDADWSNKTDKTYEQVRARELAEILLTADVSIDLHAMNKPSVPFLCCTADKAHEKIYRWFDCDRVLADPRHILGGEVVTTDEFVDANGGVGICYETGMSSDVSRVDEVMRNVMNVLRDQGMIDEQVVSRTQTTRSVYELVSVLNLTHVGFRYADDRGAGSFEAFARGDTIGYVGNDPIIAEFDGVIVFPKLPEFQALGKPIVYLAKRIH